MNYFVGIIVKIVLIIEPITSEVLTSNDEKWSSVDVTASNGVLFAIKLEIHLDLEDLKEHKLALHIIGSRLRWDRPNVQRPWETPLKIPFVGVYGGEEDYKNSNVEDGI